jgi:DNA/RNA-binding domain of Phe-tRNA-synthetase-like protein
MSPADLDAFLAGATVDPAVLALRPDYRALLVVVDGLTPTASNDVGEALLQRAEASAAQALADIPVDELPHVAAWRDAYRGFGAKPQRTRHSLEALLRRAAGGLPRVNALTDVYNAVSVIHQVPLGGEDLHEYAGPPRLRVATGAEPFDTTAHGEAVVEHPEPGEVVWCDDAGVTCRRWNWRQATRTRLRDDTTAAIFILDALAPLSDDQLTAAGDELVAHLAGLGSSVTTRQRTIGSSG